jgi:hypothetical protein
MGSTDVSKANSANGALMLAPVQVFDSSLSLLASWENEKEIKTNDMKRTREEKSCDGLTSERGSARRRRSTEEEEEEEEEEEVEEAEDGSQVSTKRPPLPRITFSSARQLMADSRKPSHPTTAAGKSVPLYTYTRIRDLTPDSTANLLGIVRDFKEPRPTRGTG